MANKTTNYGLTKPTPEDFYDVHVQNENMDIIDETLKNLDSKSASAKTTLMDADTIPLNDSADSNKIKKITWANIKTILTNVFAAKSHEHTKSEITDFPTSMPASDVYSWAKAQDKPSYTPAEIGLKTETWTFTLEDGSTVTKAVYVG